MKTRQGRNGGTLRVWEKGESGNPSGKKWGTKRLKEFLEETESQGETTMILDEKDVVHIPEKKQYEIRVSRLRALHLVFFKQMKKGNSKFWDMAFKKGFDGGYEPIKTENTNLNTNLDLDLSKLTDEELKTLETLIKKATPNQNENTNTK